MLLTVTSFALQGMALGQPAPGAPAQTATISGVVTDVSGHPIANASVRLQGPASGATVSDARGAFQFTNVPVGTYTVYVSAVNYGSSSKEGIVVSGDINVAIQFLTPRGLPTIAHASTTGRVSINISPASVAPLSPSNYAFQGVTSWRQILEQIPGVAATGNTYGGGDTNDVIPNGPFQPITLSINGAQPYETAVLLDGMPLQNASFSATPGSGVDLGTIPLNAFDAADVIRGPGADSPSIMASIGGTFLLQAPAPVTQNLYELSYANDPWGGFSSNAKIALRFGRLTTAVTFGVWDSPGPIHQGEVNAFGFDELATINGQPVSCPTMNTGPGWLNYGCFAYRVPTNVQQYYGAIAVTGLYCCVQDTAAWDTRSGSAALSYRIGNDIVAEFFYAGDMNRALQTGWIYPTLFQTPAAGYAGSIPPGIHDYLYTLGNAPEYESDSLFEEKIHGDVGQGVFQIAAIQNYSYALQDLGYPPDGAYEAWGEACLGTPTGPASGIPGTCAPGTTLTIFNGTSIRGASYGSQYGEYRDWNWPLSRDLEASYDTQVGSILTAGVSFLKSSYDDPYEVYDYYPAFHFTYQSTQPTADSETSREWRLHVSSYVSDKLYASLSWYVTSADFHVPNPAVSQSLQTPGSYTDAVYPYSAPRVALEWRASSDIAIRASAGGGYAVPPLSDLLGSNGTPSCASGTSCTVTLTNINLQPEKAFGIDLGSDVRLSPTTAASVDFYRTNLYGMFFQSGTVQGTYHGLPLVVTQYRNLQHVRMEGVDLSFQHDVAQGIFWHGSVGLTRAYVVSVPAGFYNTGGTCQPYTGVDCINTEVVQGINFSGAGYSVSAVPYANGYGSVGYRWTTHTYVQLEADYFGKNNSYYEPPFVALNGYVGVGLNQHITLLANFQNLTCVYCQSYQVLTNYPRLIAPASPGQKPYGLYALPYGPRAVVVTLNFRY